MASLILKNVRPMAGAATDVKIENGKIAAFGQNLSGDSIEDGKGAILLPGLVEAHTHLDKTLLGMPWYKNEVGPRLIDKIENEREMKSVLGIDSRRQSARQIVQSVSKGSTHIRSHVDVDTVHGLKGVEGVLASREEYADIVTMDFVAFPQSGMLGRPGTVELMADALKMGVECVGGIDPSSIERDPRQHIDIVFDLANKHGKMVDIHLHEPAELGAFSMELIIERTSALGMKGKVTVSHAFCLGLTDDAYVGRLIEGLAENDIAIVTTGPAGRPCPPVKRLRDAGVTVAAGTDGMRDTWGPYGNGDMLERAMLVGLRNNFRRDDELDIAMEVVTYGGAKLMMLEGYGLKVGDKADLVVVAGETIAEAIVNRVPRALVFKHGKVVARDGACLKAAP